jgi:translation initiation factor eIF-2B subunit gamma
LHPITDNYPLAIANVVNKPLLCYQLEYLQKYGVEEILVCVEKKYSHKIEKYLKNFFHPLKEGTCTVDLVVFAEEEENATALKMLAPKINTDIILMEGDSLLDIPLDEALDTHYMCSSSLT